MTRQRHLPPIVRRRPAGPIGRAHEDVERRMTAIDALHWLDRNDPDEAWAVFARRRATRVRRTA